MRSPRIDAAVADLASELAKRGFTTQQEIRRVAARYSSTAEEEATLRKHLEVRLASLIR